jgi:cytochrome oxidase Cu insertion factor (SCO1/SenC/PrrC family)
MPKHALHIDSRLIAITTFMVYLGAAFLTQAQESGRSQEHGLKVGEKAPEFRLKSADGKEYTLSDLRAGGKVALVFYRSADW